VPASLINWILLLLLVAMWGTSFLFTSLALETFEPIFITHIRLVMGAMVLTLFAYLKGLRLPSNLKSWGIFLLLGFFGNALPFFLIAWGQQAVPSGKAGVLMAVMPMVTLILAHFWVTGERLNRYKISGVIIGFMGVVLLLNPALQAASSLLRELAILLAASCYALNAILVRKLSSFHPVIGGAGMLIGASLLMLPLFLSQTFQFTSPAPLQWFSLIWLGVISTGVASLVYFFIILRAGPSFLANINFLVPVVAFFTGAIILNEAVTLSSLLALVVILSGIVLTRYRV